MTANKARFALTLSLALALAACGGGGGGGGGDDDPPPTLGSFDGNFMLRGTNGAGNDFAARFDDTFAANFVDGKATVNGVATEFDYPLDAQDGGCYYKRGAIDTCVERAEGKVLALCAASSDTVINSVGISEVRNAGFAEVDDEALQAAAVARTDDLLELRSLSCDDELDNNDTVTFRASGDVIQRFGNSQESLTEVIVDQLFSANGRSVGNPEIARVGAKAYRQTVGSEMTYYVVTYGAENSQGDPLPPKIFVSVD